MTKLMFDRAGINYVERNVDEDLQARLDAEDTRHRAMPIVDADEYGMWAGFQPEFIQNIIDDQKDN